LKIAKWSKGLREQQCLFRLKLHKIAVRALQQQGTDHLLLLWRDAMILYQIWFLACQKTSLPKMGECHSCKLVLNSLKLVISLSMNNQHQQLQTINQVSAVSTLERLKVQASALELVETKCRKIIWITQ
jgi:hypothetical protein